MEMIMSNKVFYSTKTFNNDRGLSCCFRQWRSTHSHCSLLHGYSIGIKLTFGCESLDERNWVFDFGGVKEFKQWAEYMFDHTLVIAEDDPEWQKLEALGAAGLADVRIVKAVGCERFAELAYDKMNELLEKAKAENRALNPTAFVHSVEVFEHGANSGICTREEQVKQPIEDAFSRVWELSNTLAEKFTGK
jgi:6-pyruvoyltetrahydropterin/6-carboxytetrahydropterin synthase